MQQWRPGQLGLIHAPLARVQWLIRVGVSVRRVMPPQFRQVVKPSPNGSSSRIDPRRSASNFGVESAFGGNAEMPYK